MNLPALLLTVLPVGMSVRFLLDIAMMVWMLEMCFVCARRGCSVRSGCAGSPPPPKASPKRSGTGEKPWTWTGTCCSVSGWGGLGGWRSPHLFPQAVGSSVLAGGSGIAMAAAYLLFFTLSGGFVVLLLRIVSSWGGPFSRLFGKFGGDVFAQFVGWILTPMALWMAVNATINVLDLGVV